MALPYPIPAKNSPGLRLGWMLGFLFLLKATLAAEIVPFLWQIERDQPAWILGTVHHPDPSLLDWPDYLNDAFIAADRVYTEIPMDPATIARAALGMVTVPEQSLDKVLPEELLQRLRAYFEANAPGVDLAIFYRTKIWALVAILPTLDQQFGAGGFIPMDMRIFRKALFAGKKTGGLETIEEQFAVFDVLTQTEQIEMLASTLDWLEQQPVGAPSAMTLMLNAFAAGDGQSLWEQFLEAQTYGTDSAGSEKLLDALLTKRDILMAARIDELLRKHPDESFFFAVGAAHLISPAAIQDHLKKLGWRVIRHPSYQAKPAVLQDGL